MFVFGDYSSFNVKWIDRLTAATALVADIPCQDTSPGEVDIVGN